MKFTAESDLELIRETESFIERFRSLIGSLPTQQRWRYIPVEAFVKMGEQILDPDDDQAIENHNRLFWTDASEAIKAYDLLTLWRAADLVEAATKSLKEKHVIAPAVLSRALLELSVAFLHFANKVEDHAAQAVAAPAGLVLSEQLEELVLKAIWGTRLGAPPDYLQQTNVLTQIKKLSKNKHAQDLMPTYEFLCEVAHPNVVGNARFQAESAVENTDGSVDITLHRHAEFIAAAEIREKTLWALGWAVYAFDSCHQMLAESVANLQSRWPPLPESTSDNA